MIFFKLFFSSSGYRRSKFRELDREMIKQSLFNFSFVEFMILSLEKWLGMHCCLCCAGVDVVFIYDFVKKVCKYTSFTECELMDFESYNNALCHLQILNSIPAVLKIKSKIYELYYTNNSHVLTYLFF